MFMTANYLEMEEKLASMQAKVKKLSPKNTSLNERVKKIGAESIEVSKQLKTVQAYGNIKNFERSEGRSFGQGKERS